MLLRQIISRCVRDSALKETAKSKRLLTLSAISCGWMLLIHITGIFNSSRSEFTAPFSVDIRSSEKIIRPSELVRRIASASSTMMTPFLPTTLSLQTRMQASRFSSVLARLSSRLKSGISYALNPSSDSSDLAKLVFPVPADPYSSMFNRPAPFAFNSSLSVFPSLTASFPKKSHGSASVFDSR